MPDDTRLEPGAEIDARIAREVMGWKLPCDVVPGYGDGEWWEPCPSAPFGWAYTGAHRTAGTYSQEEVFRPSTSDGWAFMVIDELIRRYPGKNYTLRYFGTTDDWAAWLGNTGGQSAPTRAHAICLMALMVAKMEVAR